jgi:hypothetical protein
MITYGGHHIDDDRNQLSELHALQVLTRNHHRAERKDELPSPEPTVALTEVG